MPAELVKISGPPAVRLPTIPPVPWRDPYTVSEKDLSVYVKNLEQSCVEQPHSADLRTCLGMAYAVRYDVYKSLDALEAATRLDPTHFWARLKYGELQYRLRVLVVAERETVKAMDLAGNGWQLSLARKQLQEIRRLNRDSTRTVTWDKPLTMPTVVLTALMVLLFIVMTWK